MQMFNQCARQRSMTKVTVQGFTNRGHARAAPVRACVRACKVRRGGERAAGGAQIPGMQIGGCAD